MRLKITFILFFLICTQELNAQNPTNKINNTKNENHSLFFRSEDNLKDFLGNALKITQGMKKSEIEKLLGKADQVHELYPPIKNAKNPIGTTETYIIHNSNEKTERFIRIFYDLNHSVMRIDKNLD